MREQPESVLKALQAEVNQQNQIVISAITYAEMRFGAIGKKASPKHNQLVDAFLKRLDGVLPWDRKAVDATTIIKKALSDAGEPIGANDTAIAGHAIATGCILVTNNTKEFARVNGLAVEDWI
jgi:tRNA(fMet)-specific endonuclease VapC